MSNSTSNHQQGRETQRFHIGDLVLDTGKHQVSRDEIRLDVTGLSYQLLLVLARNAPNVVSHDELVEQVWPGKVISPETVTQRIKLTRQALEDDAIRPRYIGLVRGQGYRMLADVEVLGAEERNQKKERVAILLVLSVATLGLSYLLYQYVQEQADLAIKQEHTVQLMPNSIAVLPFTDLSPNGDQEYFAEGIAEELLTQLTMLDGVSVIGRSASFAFKGSELSPRNIGVQLGVEKILDGSVRKDEDKLRITAQLIDATTGVRIWSRTYDSTTSDIFYIQEDIARSVASALSIVLDVDGRNHLPGTGTDNIEAYDAYLAGRAWARVGRITEAKPHYQDAVDIDPTYADGWSALGAATGMTSWDQPSEQARRLQHQGRDLVLQALELDPRHAGAWDHLSSFNWVIGDWIGSAEAANKSAALTPGKVDSRISGASFLARVGRTRHSIELNELSGIKPRGYYGAQRLSEMYIQVGRYDDARATLEISESLTATTSPSIIFRKLFIALSEKQNAGVREHLADFGNANREVANISDAVLAEFDSSPQDILAILRQIFESDKHMTGEGRILIASLAAYYDDPELALEVISTELRGNLVRTGRIWYPFFSDMRRLSGFEELVSEIGLVEYWRKFVWADTCRALGDDDFECS